MTLPVNYASILYTRHAHHSDFSSLGVGGVRLGRIRICDESAAGGGGGVAGAHQFQHRWRISLGRLLRSGPKTRTCPCRKYMNPSPDKIAVSAKTQQSSLSGHPLHVVEPAGEQVLRGAHFRPLPMHRCLTLPMHPPALILLYGRVRPLWPMHPPCCGRVCLLHRVHFGGLALHH